eukprot:m.4991 g.4991  ORF g.4991 m.4991 type:complete len:442 (+) comp3156_c0_seq1:139-1464(+)
MMQKVAIVCVAYVVVASATIEFKLHEEDSQTPHLFDVLAGVDVKTNDDNVKYERKLHSNGVEAKYDGYSASISFGGYSSSSLCARYNRTEPVNGHTQCALVKDWFQLWPYSLASEKENACFIDDMQAYQSGNTLNSPPHTEIRLGKCPPKEDDTWPGGYDWRYGSIRPQDNPDMALYPEVKRKVEEANEKKPGKKAIVVANSGGTINAYAFLMSQTQEWRDKNILAFIAKDPVFGGTISSIRSIVSGWGQKGMDRCTGRAAATLLPSVLWMWPRAGENEWAWNKTEIIVSTTSKNYTAYDLHEMLLDMGLTKTAALLKLEQTDMLDKFLPPLVDTYAFYGYGIGTEAGFILKRDFSPSLDGENVCPDGVVSSFKREYDNGDGVGPLRSTSRASAWAEPHKQHGIVLKNYGYKGMGHTCNAECKKDYDCVMAKLEGKNPTGC